MRNELFERQVLGVYWCMYVVARLARLAKQASSFEDVCTGTWPYIL